MKYYPTFISAIMNMNYSKKFLIWSLPQIGATAYHESSKGLNFFYGFKDVTQTYEGNIEELKIEFINKSPEICPKISFYKLN